MLRLGFDIGAASCIEIGVQNTLYSLRTEEATTFVYYL